MKRLPLLLAALAGVLIVGSGSALAATSPPVNSSLPTIGGTAREAQTLTASNGSWTGTAPISYAYRWQRCNSAGSSCSSISGATNQNYVLSHGDLVLANEAQHLRQNRHLLEASYVGAPISSSQGAGGS